MTVILLELSDILKLEKGFLGRRFEGALVAEGVFDITHEIRSSTKFQGQHNSATIVVLL